MFVGCVNEKMRGKEEGDESWGVRGGGGREGRFACVVWEGRWVVGRMVHRDWVRKGLGVEEVVDGLFEWKDVCGVWI